MRIPSDFKDYYDKLLYLFQDEVPPVYVRKQNKVFHPFPEDIDVPQHWYMTRDYPKLEDPKVIIFCGKAFVCYRVTEENGDVKYIYDKDEIIETNLRSNRLQHKWARDRESTIRNKWDELFKKLSEKDWDKVNIELKTPIIMYESFQNSRWGAVNHDKANILVNPCLKDFDFIKAVDPYTAIQELHMFLDNQLVENNEPPQIMDDKVIAAAKGFGHKYAFKQEPTKPKRRKRRVVKKRT